MAITSFKETWSGEVSRRNGSVRRYSRRFVAQTDSDLDRARDVRLHGACPKVGDPYPSDALALCVDVDVVHLQGAPRIYEAFVEYSSTSFVFSSEDPLLRPAERSFTQMTIREIYTRDESDPRKAVVNTARLPFAQAQERDRAYPVFRITLNQSFFNFTEAVNYAYVCNSDGWNGFAAGQALSLPKVGDEVREGGTLYWRNTYEVALREEGWDDLVLNTGRMKLNAAGTDWEDIRDVNGDLITDDVILSADGKSALPPGTQPSDSHFLRFQPYKRRPFIGVIPT